MAIPDSEKKICGNCRWAIPTASEEGKCACSCPLPKWAIVNPLRSSFVFFEEKARCSCFELALEP